MLSEFDTGLEYLILLTCLWLLLQLYFRVARRFRIIDKPNHRSSHSHPTIRGGGIIVIVAVLIWFVCNHFSYPWFVVGCLLIASISLADDVKPQHPTVRFLIHLIAFGFLIWQVSWLSPWWFVLLTAIIGIGAINAFNFMDGINGITAGYALVNLLTLLFINHRVTEFTSGSFIIYVVMSVLVFMLYNFRRVARCFAGDVGSIVLAYIQVFLVLQLVYGTDNFKWVLLFLVYGIDSVATIAYRLVKKENIFQPHRSHLYQYLTNERGYSHLFISLVYGLVQLSINAILIFSSEAISAWLATGLIAGMTAFYLVLRESVLKQIGKEGVFINLFK